MAARSISHTSRAAMAYGITLWENDIMWPFSGAIDPLIRTEACVNSNKLLDVNN